MQRTGGFRAAAVRRRIHGERVSFLWTPDDLQIHSRLVMTNLIIRGRRGGTHVVIIPNFTDNRSAGIIAAMSRLGRIVARARASNVGLRTRLLGQDLLEIRKRISCLVARHDLLFVQPFPGRIAFVILDGSFEEVHHVLMFDILGAVAREVKSREAGRVLAELVGPEIGIGRSLVDPVCVHPIDQVVAAERL